MSIAEDGVSEMLEFVARVPALRAMFLPANFASGTSGSHGGGIEGRGASVVKTCELR